MHPTPLSDARDASSKAGQTDVSNETDRHGGSGVFAALAQWLRGRLTEGEHTASRLAIEALPDDLATLAPGALHAVHVTPGSPECDALIWSSARAANTRHVTVVLARERAQAAARLRELGFSGAAAQGWPRHLNVLAMPADAPTEAGAEGPVTEPPAFARLFGGLRALKRFGLRRGALVFVEGAGRWFSWNDQAALAREGRLLSGWCASRGITMVLLLGPNAGEEEDDLDDAPPYAGRSELNGACAGVARVRRSHGELLWQVDFWRAGKALVTGDVRALRFTGDGRLTVAPQERVATDQAGQQSRLARDEQRVVTCHAVTGAQAGVPHDWEVLADRDAVVAECEGARGATIVLAYRNRAELDALCAAVHTLRRRCGRALKIAVVERGEVLRHQYELLMLSLGANLVVGRDVPFSRLESLLQSLQGQLYTRALVPDYRTALAASLADAALGYLNLAAFCAHTHGALARGALLRLPHVLARLTLPPALAHVEALGQCHPRRAGDVFTADATHLYVFLFGCRQADAGAALARIFTAPVESIAKDVTYLANEQIEAALQVLEAANRRAPAADYTDLFAASSRPQIAHVEQEPQAADSIERARAELAAIEHALHEDTRRHAALDELHGKQRVRRAVPARMPLAEPRN
ncbi:cellulose biosynthesis protein BcsE [Caballeronia sp. LZ065]|uniref:cellulose biosynthesis protein BcsE n=1 Tax=Caballeronia sp. LZ065 TaxID=3038571 RepID=UPI00286141F7|nr:cellulose biosynthesis protein BcsE [Caballeronia sp. LZ065]MDR5784812.1 cellulose biosynthesis protein BcsE [Caballeronia sp. LZ065]